MSATSIRFKVERLERTLLNVHAPPEPATFLLASDIHYDNPKCDRSLFHSLLDECRSMAGAAFLFGDVLCLMQGKFDKRGSKASVRPEHNGEDGLPYFDSVIQDSAAKLGQWSDILLMMSQGNHETGIINRIEIDPLKRLVDTINLQHGGTIEQMPYQGWVRFFLGDYPPVTLFYHHGAWGGIVTKGTMGGGRYASIAPDADIIINGHNHERTIVEHPCFRVSPNGVNLARRWHVQTGTMKQEFESGDGWAIEKIVMPKPLGGVWLTLLPNPDTGKVDVRLQLT